MGRGDKILFHAVGHVRLYAAGELVGSPWYEPQRSQFGERFPWVYPVRVDVWVLDVLDGPRTTEVAPAKAIGYLQSGGPYAPVTREEYEDMVAALNASPT